jgi:hypothetical protein
MVEAPLLLSAPFKSVPSFHFHIQGWISPWRAGHCRNRDALPSTRPFVWSGDIRSTTCRLLVSEKAPSLWVRNIGPSSYPNLTRCMMMSVLELLRAIVLQSYLHTMSLRSCRTPKAENIHWSALTCSTVRSSLFNTAMSLSISKSPCIRWDNIRYMILLQPAFLQVSF